jgi:tRNA threonylcarbamoyladenosine biosynthesis protein TsaE
VNTNERFEMATSSAADTQSLGRSLASLLSGGDVIELASDLGGGKTTFVQGIAAGLGYGGSVTSPTFTLSNIYKLDDGQELHHYDLYRLGVGGVLLDELVEDLQDERVITIIE